MVGTATEDLFHAAGLVASMVAARSWPVGGGRAA